LHDSTTRFSDRVEDYERYRPSYPPEIIDALLDGYEAPFVADLGAGTGISARLLRDAGATVYAVEPNATMHSVLRQHAGIVPIDGTAEATTLPDAGVDIVTAFQAYHWFDADATLREAGRVAKQRARFGAVWNHRCRDDDFTLGYESVAARYDRSKGALDRDRRAGTIVDDFKRHHWTNLRIVRAMHTHELTLDRLTGFARSCSYLPRTGPEFEAMSTELHELYARHAESALPAFRFETNAFIADRP
jgi:SAM-dependent methyltransferase